MINFAKEHHLLDEDKWPHIPSVFVKGAEGEPDITPAMNLTNEQKIEVSQAWKNIAVLKVSSSTPTAFYIGYSNMDAVVYLEYEFTTNEMLGLRLGGGDVRFFALPKDINQKITLELVEVISEDNPQYPSLKVL